MKLLSLFFPLLLALASATPVAARISPPPQGVASHAAVDGEQTGQVRTAQADSDVVVTLCVESGDVVVHGWDRREVRARASEAGRIELRGAGEAGKPAKRLEVLIAHSEDDEMETGGCAPSSNVLLEVPRGATVVLQVQSGDIAVTDVAEARIVSTSGDVEVSRISKALEIEKMSGDISVRDSSGRVRLRTFSGQIEAVNVRRNEDSDYFSARTTSGELSLERLTHARIEAATVSGDINYQGSLVRGGSYDFKTHSGSIGLTLPADASFKLNAKVIAQGDIATDFPIRTASGAPVAKELTQGRLTGTVGTGEAEVTLISFNGTLHLKKRN